MTLEPGTLRLLKCPFCGNEFVSAATNAAKCRSEKCGKTFVPKQCHVIEQSIFPTPVFVTADKLPRSGNYGKVQE